MVQRIMVLVIIIVLTTFLFFIIHGNRNSHEGMATQIVKINGIEITKDTSSDVLEDLKQKGLDAKARFEQAIAERRKNIKENNRAKSILEHEKDAYEKEINENQAKIDTYNTKIETADTNNQTFTVENEILETNIDKLLDRLSDLQTELEIIEKSEDSTRKKRKEKIKKIKVNKNNQNRASSKIDNKTQKINYNEEQMIDVTYFQTMLTSLLNRQIDLETLLLKNREKMVQDTNLNKENENYIHYYKTKINAIQKDITYLEAALQDLTSRTNNPGNASGTVSSLNSGA